MAPFLALRLLLGPAGVGAIVLPRPPAASGPHMVEQEGNTLDVAAATDKNRMCYDSAVKSAQPFWLPETTKLALAVHRKTGHVLAGNAANCFNNSEVVRIDGRDALKVGANVSVMHITRDPIDLAVSNYLYNFASSTELGTVKPGTAGHHMKVCRHLNAKVADSVPQNTAEESLREYLGRLPESTRLIFTMCESIGLLGKMVEVTQWCSERENCMEMQLGEFMESSYEFWQAWIKIEHLGNLKLTTPIRECLKLQDMHSRHFMRENHCTSHIVSQAERDRLKALAAQLDWATFGGVFANASTGKEPKRVKRRD